MRRLWSWLYSCFHFIVFFMYFLGLFACDYNEIVVVHAFEYVIMILKFAHHIEQVSCRDS